MAEDFKKQIASFNKSRLSAALTTYFSKKQLQQLLNDNLSAKKKKDLLKTFIF